MNNSLLPPIVGSVTVKATVYFAAVHPDDGNPPEIHAVSSSPAAPEYFARWYYLCGRHKKITIERCEVDIPVGVDVLATKVHPYRVDIVRDSTGRRVPACCFENKQRADKLADWFGRDGDLRAEVVELDGTLRVA
ncbi:MAG TPA: hypothetical protein VG826_34910 [Pirellulales bacterium]|nr:hypothetical protein [Pirellulales bacterium]